MRKYFLLILIFLGVAAWWTYNPAESDNIESADFDATIAPEFKY